MPLPEPAPRQSAHTRTVTFRGFEREDGLWDIEAELTDVKPFEITLDGRHLSPGMPVHGLQIRLTIDDQMVIHAVATAMDHIPQAECVQAPKHMDRLIGCTLGRGWRRTTEERLGRTEGCTHLREMLFNMATAAIQMLYNGLPRKRERLGLPVPPMTRMPPHLDQCMTWALDGPATERNYPMFFRPREQAIPPEATPPAA